MRYFLFQHLHNASVSATQLPAHKLVWQSIEQDSEKGRESVWEREAASDISTISAQIRDLVGIKCADVKLFWSVWTDFYLIFFFCNNLICEPFLYFWGTILLQGVYFRGDSCQGGAVVLSTGVDTKELEINWCHIEKVKRFEGDIVRDTQRTFLLNV